MLRLHTPSPQLARYIEVIWHDDGDRAGDRERVLPAGGFLIVIEIDGGSGVVIGMRSKFLDVDTSATRSVIGIMFRPGGALPFFDVAASELYNDVETLDTIWRCPFRGLRDRLCSAPTVVEKFRVLECELLRRIRPRVGLHRAVQYGLTEFQRAPHLRRVLDVTRDAGLSRRRFAQLFREQVGMTPKLYCRLRRFHHVMRQIQRGESVDWADVAAANGYADQAHLSHEFRDFSGLSPAAFLSAERASSGHGHIRVD